MSTVDAVVWMTSNNDQITDQNGKGLSNVTNAVSRRNVLKKSALLAAGTGTVGLGTTGPALAASACTGSGSYQKETDYAWDDDDTASADNYDCDNGLAPFHKVEHGSSVIYLTSTQGATRWIHEFMVIGHAEHFERYCSTPWSRENGLVQHNANFDLNMPSLAIAPEADKFVKSHPDYGNGDDADELLDWAFTGLTIALGAANWKVGTAAQITAVLLDNLGDTPSGTGHDLTYKWGDTGNPPNGVLPCGTHFVKQLVEGTNSSGEFSFDYVDEAWGGSGMYTQIQFNVDPPLSTQGTGAVTTNSSNKPVPQKGDVIENSENQTVRVEKVSQSKIHWRVRKSGRSISNRCHHR